VVKLYFHFDKTLVKITPKILVQRDPFFLKNLILTISEENKLPQK